MVKMKENGLASRGFTLIELLVVIAIIGLLAAVVLASVGSARNKGADASIKSQMNAARSQAELYAANNGNKYYTAAATNVCVATQALNGFASILLNAASSINGATVLGVNVGQTAGNVACSAAATTWAASAPLTTSGRFWCVDSSGNAKETATLLSASALACP
ncbi:MAG TPA: type II secretion system protein [Candidatus Paceibacterota bacterium]